ncbi:PilZ domain-containing protein [Gimesia algae]|uniref:PilZ domain protein n=1 Tax=Gimesia algae TaxID=2527971 RepID=A0A517VLK5_9PLAN|nr:PilZ domain-containing protein [Gimesia algae]QDT93903.1 PilZ domain protein [Gimesia algae]
MTDRRKSTNRRSGEERRLHQRLQAGPEIRLLRSGENGGSEPLNAVLYDVSLDGIRILLDLPLSIGETLLIQVHHSGEHLFNSTVKVMWQKLTVLGQYTTGCEMCVSLTAKQSRTLKSYLEHNPGPLAATLHYKT